MSNSLKLVISIIIDLLGFASYILPFGESLDLIFAPVQFLWIRYAYKSTRLAFLGGLEELLPFTDLIPASTIAHFLSK